MSVARSCAYIEVRPSEWYYIIEDPGSPKDAFDWHDFCSTHGPFATQDEANAHCRDNHVNPGGYSECPFNPASPPSQAELDLIAKARLSSDNAGHLVRHAQRKARMPIQEGTWVSFTVSGKERLGVVERIEGPIGHQVQNPSFYIVKGVGAKRCVRLEPSRVRAA